MTHHLLHVSLIDFSPMISLYTYPEIQEETLKKKRCHFCFMFFFLLFFCLEKRYRHGYWKPFSHIYCAAPSVLTGMLTTRPPPPPWHALQVKQPRGTRFKPPHRETLGINSLFLGRRSIAPPVSNAGQYRIYFPHVFYRRPLALNKSDVSKTHTHAHTQDEITLVKSN